MVQRIPENMGKYCYECRAQLEYTGPTLRPKYCSDQCQQALERRQRRNRPPSPETELLRVKSELMRAQGPGGGGVAAGTVAEKARRFRLKPPNFAPMFV